VTKAAEYYFCTVGPISGGEVGLNPSASYGLNLQAPALQAPADTGEHYRAVVTGDEMHALRGRGFTVELMARPFSSQQGAEDALDDWWEDSHRMGGDEQ
jgi:hypothetical protein